MRLRLPTNLGSTPEDGLDRPQLLVFQRHIFWGKVRVGAEDPFPVEARILVDLLLVDDEAFALLRGLEVSAIAL